MMELQMRRSDGPQLIHRDGCSPSMHVPGKPCPPTSTPPPWRAGSKVTDMWDRNTQTGMLLGGRVSRTHTHTLLSWFHSFQINIGGSCCHSNAIVLLPPPSPPPPPHLPGSALHTASVRRSRQERWLAWVAVEGATQQKRDCSSEDTAVVCRDNEQGQPVQLQAGAQRPPQRAGPEEEETQEGRSKGAWGGAGGVGWGRSRSSRKS